MNTRTLLVLCTALLFLPWVGIARAEEVWRMHEIDFDITHDLASSPNVENINLLDGTPTKEFDTWPQEIRASEGIYWGNLFPAATVVTTKLQGEMMSMRTVMRIPEADIATGASQFWIRIPLDGRTIWRIGLKIDGSVNANITMEEWGDVWVFENGGDSEKVLWTDRGIFVLLTYALSTQYKFELTPAGNTSGGAVYYGGDPTVFVIDLVMVTPFEGQQIMLLMTEEEYVLSTENYFLSNWKLQVVLDADQRVWFKRNFGVFPAWAFIFVSGLPSTGGFCYEFRSMTRNGYNNRIFIDKRIPDTEIEDNYITIHLPYLGRSAWDVVVNISGGTYSDASVSWSASIGARSDFLSFSTAFNVTPSAGFVDVSVILTPGSDITLFATHDMWLRHNFDPVSPVAYEEGRVRDMSYVPIGGAILPPYITPVWANIYVTEGVITLLTWDGQKTHLDFGWGRGYRWPGEVEVWIQLDGQTEIWWRGNVEVLYGGIISKDIDKHTVEEREALYMMFGVGGEGEIPLDERNILEILYYAIKNMGSKLWDGIKGIISTVWSYVARALEFIGNFVISLVGRIIAFLKSMITFLGNILKGALYILPVSLMLMSFKFVSNPGDFSKDLKKTTTSARYQLMAGERREVRMRGVKMRRYKRREERYKKKMREV